MEISQLAGGGQGGRVEVASTRVVDHVGRRAGHEARLELLLDALDALVAHRRARVRLLVDRLGVGGVLVAEAALEDDGLDRRASGDAEWVAGLAAGHVGRGACGAAVGGAWPPPQAASWGAPAATSAARRNRSRRRRPWVMPRRR
jgi:hypothetical protein